MALVEPQDFFLMSQYGKDEEGPNDCDSIFDQFLDSSHPALLEGNDGPLSTSNNAFDVPNARSQKEAVQRTTPLLGTDALGSATTLEAKQPQPKEPTWFLARTLNTWEQNAADDEARTQQPEKTKTTLTQSDQSFLSPTSWNTAVNKSWSGGLPISTHTGSGAQFFSGDESAQTVGSPLSSPTMIHSPMFSNRSSSATDSFMSRSLSMPRRLWTARQADAGSLWTPSTTGQWNDDGISPLASTLEVAQIHSSTASPTTSNAPPACSHFPTLAVPNSLPKSLAPRSAPIDGLTPQYQQYSTSLQTSPFPEHAFANIPSSQVLSPSLGSTSSTMTTPEEQFLFEQSYEAGDMPFVYTSNHDSNDGLGIDCNPLVGPSPAHGGYLRPSVPSTNNSPHLYSPSLPSPRAKSSSRVSTHSQASSSLHSSKARESSLLHKHHTVSDRVSSSSSSSSTRRLRRSKSHLSTASRNAFSTSDPAEKSGFVNFTTQDGTELLKGVAPSGSSKTKARREREAAEKRRKLNQAAVRAVVEAGGDLSTFYAAGISA